MTIFARAALALTVALGACGSPTDHAPKAKVAKPAAAAPADHPGAPGRAAAADPAPKAPAAPAPGELALDPAQSAVKFVGSKVTASHAGHFPEVSGAARLDDERPAAVEVTVQVGSLQADEEKLRVHLLSEDFFDAAKFPTATFRSTRIEPKASPEGTHEVAGELTLHGTTRPITFPARIQVTPGQVRGQAKFTIDRKDFGIVYPGMADDLIRDEVLLDLDLVFPRDP